jgi:hypothetical protein
MATTIKNGEVVTSTATEQEFEISRPYTDPIQSVRLLWKSGTVQFGVGEKKTAFTPVITSSNDSLAASGDKALVDVENGVFNLRLKGSGTVQVTW